MAEFKETVEAIAQEEADVRRLFNKESDGVPVRGRRRSPEYLRDLKEAVDFIAEVESGQRPMYHLREAMSSSDFPILFADVLDRQLLAAYEEMSPTWNAYARRAVVPDFRNVKRNAVDGAEAVLPEVDELEEYPEASLAESEDEYHVRKYGRRLDLSWEAMINDDLDAFRQNPERLARAARRSEERFATGLFVDDSGPHASLYTAGASNIIDGNPELSLDGLQAGLQIFTEQVDEDGEPIVIDAVELVIPPALIVPAENILNAITLDINEGSDTVIRAQNWMRNRLSLTVAHYIPHIVDGEAANNCWFLFANPNTGRPALEFGFLRGHEQPALYERMPNARRVGGGGDAQESFEDDSRAWRIRHVFGGARLVNTGGRKATVASDGSGS